MNAVKLKELPFEGEMEPKRVLKKLNGAHRALAELKGLASSIPNESILINTLGLQEAKDSSEIENIVTTYDELYKTELFIDAHKSLAGKEVQNYIEALKRGFQLIQSHNFLTLNYIIDIQSVLEGNNAGFRKVPGTVLKNDVTDEVVYTPPQDFDTIQKLMSNLEQFINKQEISDLDPLVKMAIIHHQFESIHPFYNGNGRTGRIINILFLVMENLLDIPILYLSRYIIKHKATYYRLLQEVRKGEAWEEWILFMITGVEEIAKETITLIKKIKDLLNNLFKHPYTKIEFIERDLGVSRITAANYLNKLAKYGLLKKEKLGTANYYINERLYGILTV